MESIALIGLVGGLGYYFSQKNDSERTEMIRNIAERDPAPNSMPALEKPVSANIYSSKMFEAADNEVFKLSQHKYNESAIPSVSAVLPPIYNSYSSIGVDPNNNIKEPSWKQLAQIDAINRRSDINTGKQPDLPDRPMFKSLLNLDSVITNSEFTNFGVGQTSNQELSILTGLPIEREHNNQVPFFGGSVKQNVEQFTNESLLDNYTGNTSHFFHKEEAPQRFDNRPEYGVNGNTKTPAFTENIDTSRFIPSRYKQSEKPFYEERIAAPIAFTIDNPVTTAQLTQPTIDQLRVANKPQISYEAKINAGKGVRNDRGIIGSITKTSPDTSFELGHDRLFTGPGAVVAKMSDQNFSNIQQPSRQHFEYYGQEQSRVSGTMQRAVLDNSNQLNNF